MATVLFKSVILAPQKDGQPYRVAEIGGRRVAFICFESTQPLQSGKTYPYIFSTDGMVTDNTVFEGIGNLKKMPVGCSFNLWCNLQMRSQKGEDNYYHDQIKFIEVLKIVFLSVGEPKNSDRYNKQKEAISKGGYSKKSSGGSFDDDLSEGGISESDDTNSPDEEVPF